MMLPVGVIGRVFWWMTLVIARGVAQRQDGRSTRVKDE
jgi:hypothetical protein